MGREQFNFFRFFVTETVGKYSRMFVSFRIVMSN